jgi:flavin-dependent thymidylate synthase
MKVTLISFTQNALELLLFTKNTRLTMQGIGLDGVGAWSDEKKMAELAYMLNTIRSSWEFVDFTFTIEGVTRGFTHQFVRHRVGTSFAQQSQRTVNMTGFDYVTPDGIDDNHDLGDIYNYHMNQIRRGYDELIVQGAQPEDARGLLPTNVSTNIVFKANLRTLSQMCGDRLCVKAQGEFQDVMMSIRDEVIRVYPWTEPMLRVHCAQTGVCCFPSVTNCKIKDGVFNPETGVRYDEHNTELEFSDGDGGFTSINQDTLPLTKNEIQALWVSLDGKAKK